MQRPPGFSLIEALVVLALIGIAAAVAYPSATEMMSAGRAASGARYLAGRFQALRWESVAKRRGHGLLFFHGEAEWSWQIVQDGNGNGVRTAEVRRGVDRVLSGPHRLSDIVEGVHLGFPPGGPFPKIPPRRGVIGNLNDPVQFGRSDLVGFSSFGSSSSGTVYVTDGRYALYGVVLFGPTVRVRVWRYDTRQRRWVL